LPRRCCLLPRWARWPPISTTTTPRASANGSRTTCASGSTTTTYFFDVTSKLYYKRLTPDGYRQAAVGFFWAGTSNDRSFECIFRNLPADRPSAPVGTY